MDMVAKPTREDPEMPIALIIRGMKELSNLLEWRLAQEGKAI